MMPTKHALLLLACLLAAVAPTVSAQATGRRAKPSGPGLSHFDADARATARTTDRKTDDPYGFVKGGRQHKKNKDCGCPGTKKGERQRRKEYRSRHKRR